VTAGLMAANLLLLLTGRHPLTVDVRLLDRGFLGAGSLSGTLITATPLLFTGLAAATAFRMQVWNIGAEGQLYMGAVAASGAGLAFGSWPTALVIPAMVAAGLLGGAVWGALPGLLRAYLNANEIITSLMLNYVAGLFITYLIFDSRSFWRDLASHSARVFPQGRNLAAGADWPALAAGPLEVPLGFGLGLVAATLLWFLNSRTRFGFETRLIGDSRPAARYAGVSIARTMVVVMCISGAVAGLGGASEVGDFRHLLDPRGLQQSGFGYAGIVVAALARYNPFAIGLVAILLGGLTNAGYSLQGPDLPAGLVGTMQGLILFFTLGGELLLRYRVRFRSAAALAESG
jgi:simple sugar transport system permease protein